MFGNVLIILNILLLCINLTIAVVLFILFTNLLKERINEKIIQYRDFNQIAKKNGTVFVGDSLTEFYHVHEFFHSHHIYNRGIASDTTRGVLARLNSNVISLMPKMIFLQIGTNDFNKPHAVDYITNNIKLIIEKIKAELPETKIYLISLYPINPKIKFLGRISTYPRKNKKIDHVNNLLKDYAENNDITYIDINGELKDEKGNLRAEYTMDGLHITYSGYQLITNILKKHLDKFDE
ncbi:MAG: GDSL-type esterase/lipase family protein [Bacilli bacterium]|nr:GDSL-type esterase/lipase family protein [Bacilli bacterium]MDD4076378.1 GDSL-type esterase/lipase family protein [Bacilli bacterium]MDD4388650.1 GDSL-type esterase/lipase family protein [Bacilli bacterium]